MSLQPSPAMKFLGREWTPADLDLLATLWGDSETTSEMIAARFNVNEGSLRQGYWREPLGLGQRPRVPVPNRLGKVKIPPNANPLVKQFFDLLNQNRVTQKWVAEEAGLAPITVWQWQTNEPLLGNFVAALDALGYKLVIKEK